uniref:Thioredoxin domain-containing protein n=1 Tax=Bicosoecida sp. CB-2014 TaxID=1486930 RepID=A0A7S1CGP6_9STRA|mmetsp:Transcript_24245/g.84222  ORF Transcript_24245/g.84222 Transcript_24245/m.84222 type:complete len:268 (+) Transcript_24245:134-937(+)|eukprot:CAMPEP_0203810920 /NCGR_PEP_ID=MMETSP0115-20131106/3233_1 /ASSEMBLY_ACC=CAM_ASM_000227 /TAXON_ID=33651 /ORGANISM="Bicosoecid sp, Strain ms1" /LENGTH=267 /DNA_ID=CAMNT_0050719725 /DNA_START=131 /DNA_END=934 /DNA_ORIENTATION=+
MSMSSGFLAPEAHLESSERMSGALEDLREKYDRIAEVEETKARADAAVARAEEAAAAPDSEDEWLDEMERDPEMEAIREARLKQLKEAADARKEHLALGHGEYREIVEEEFLSEVTKSKQVVLHLYHAEFPRCKIYDKHLRILAPKFVHTKFIYMDAEKAPFFVGKLKVRVLPTLVSFIDGVAVDRITGMEGLGGDEFPTARLRNRLKVSGVLKVPGRPDDDDDGSDEEAGWGSDGERRDGATYAEHRAARRARVRVGGAHGEVGET